MEVLAPFSQAQRPGKTELRLFGGLAMDETSELLAISPATLKRPWATARIWLHHEVGRNAHTCLPNAANRSATCSHRGMLHGAFNRSGRNRPLILVAGTTPVRLLCPDRLNLRQSGRERVCRVP